MNFCPINKYLIIHGGKNQRNLILSDIAIFDIVKNIWSEVITYSMVDLIPRTCHATYLDGSELIVFGGFNVNGFISTCTMMSCEFNQVYI